MFMLLVVGYIIFWNHPLIPIFSLSRNKGIKRRTYSTGERDFSTYMHVKGHVVCG